VTPPTDHQGQNSEEIVRGPNGEPQRKKPRKNNTINRLAPMGINATSVPMDIENGELATYVPDNQFLASNVTNAANVANAVNAENTTNAANAVNAENTTNAANAATRPPRTPETPVQYV